jgi:penicillin-binding protein 1A
MLPPPTAERAERRRDDILRLMVRAGWLSEGTKNIVAARPIQLVARSKLKTDAPAVVENVFAELKRLGDARLSVEALVQGRIRVQATVDHDLQHIVNEALENGLLAYERRHPKARGVIQGSVVVLDNADARILAEAGGRQVFQERYNSYSDYNRVTGSLRQPGSVMKPIVYLTAFRKGYTLDSIVPDEPISVPTGVNDGVKWIQNYDARFKGPIPVRKALAESRNVVAIWLAREIGLQPLARTARELGIHTPLQPYITTALGASEVNLLEMANAYRTMASGLVAEPHVIQRVVDSAGAVLHETRSAATPLRVEPLALREIQEGLRGVIRLPTGTAHALASQEFDIPVMGKTGTTSDFRDALFVGSTYGKAGITVAVRIGFDDNRALGSRETGGQAAMPVFREIVQRVYRENLRGPVPEFPADLEASITDYLEWSTDDVEDTLLASTTPEEPARVVPVVLPDPGQQACGSLDGASIPCHASQTAAGARAVGTGPGRRGHTARIGRGGVTIPLPWPPAPRT